MKVSIIHRYLENRLNERNYPKHHKWGIEGLENYSAWNARLLSTSSLKIPIRLEYLLNKTLFRGSPGSKVELSSLRAAQKSDLIYSISGPLALAHLYPKKLVSWVYSTPPNLGSRFKLSHLAYKPYNLKANAGFLCLTPKAESFYSQFAPSKFIPWCVDTKIFNGEPPRNSTRKPFFLATGKTYRDYETLIKAAKKIKTEVRIIAPSAQKQKSFPSNVVWLNSSTDPPDQAIDYITLREWYAQCIAVCIPLTGDANDTCGYTNMLEAMAMGKPVLMTESGCLHLKPDKGGYGIEIKPKDINGWINAMNYLIKEPINAVEMGNKGRRIVVRDFSIEHFNNEVVNFIKTIIE